MKYKGVVVFQEYKEIAEEHLYGKTPGTRVLRLRFKLEAEHEDSTESWIEKPDGEDAIYKDKKYYVYPDDKQTGIDRIKDSIKKSFDIDLTAEVLDGQGLIGKKAILICDIFVDEKDCSHEYIKYVNNIEWKKTRREVSDADKEVWNDFA